jgi:phosphatidylglycerophosphate synthase
MAYLVLNEAWIGAAVVLSIAVVTDISDGYIARIRNQTTALGGFLDHSSDAVFVTLLLIALAEHGLVSLVLPVFVVAAFLQYTFDSKVLEGLPLRTSSLGRYNGISYFIFGGLPVMQNALQIYIIPDDYFPYLGWGLVLSTTISMLDRAYTLISKNSNASLDK